MEAKRSKIPAEWTFFDIHKYFEINIGSSKANASCWWSEVKHSTDLIITSVVSAFTLNIGKMRLRDKRKLLLRYIAAPNFRGEKLYLVQLPQSTI